MTSVRKQLPMSGIHTLTHGAVREAIGDLVETACGSEQPGVLKILSSVNVPVGKLASRHLQPRNLRVTEPLVTTAGLHYGKTENFLPDEPEGYPLLFLELARTDEKVQVAYPISYSLGERLEDPMLPSHFAGYNFFGLTKGHLYLLASHSLAAFDEGLHPPAIGIGRIHDLQIECEFPTTHSGRLSYSVNPDARIEFLLLEHSLESLERIRTQVGGSLANQWGAMRDLFGMLVPDAYKDHKIAERAGIRHPSSGFKRGSFFGDYIKALSRCTPEELAESPDAPIRRLPIRPDALAQTAAFVAEPGYYNEPMLWKCRLDQLFPKRVNEAVTYAKA